MEKEVACHLHKPASVVQYVTKQILIALLVIRKTINWKTLFQKFNEFNINFKEFMEKEVARHLHKSASAVQFVIKQIRIALLVIRKTFNWRLEFKNLMNLIIFLRN